MTDGRTAKLKTRVDRRVTYIFLTLTRKSQGLVTHLTMNQLLSSFIISLTLNSWVHTDSSNLYYALSVFAKDGFGFRKAQSDVIIIET